MKLGDGVPREWVWSDGQTRKESGRCSDNADNKGNQKILVKRVVRVLLSLSFGTRGVILSTLTTLTLSRCYRSCCLSLKKCRIRPIMTVRYRKDGVGDTRIHKSASFIFTRIPNIHSGTFQQHRKPKIPPWRRNEHK